jgi:membrane-bound lytic murein transglycosylase D
MKAKFGYFIFGFFISINLFAQEVPLIEVPDEIDFAGMNLKFTNGAKEILRKDMAAMTKNPKYFYSKVELANLYFPLIEKVFEEESFPKDFKYLALQESSLIADAVSKSNAVGYWQFKKESAVEVGLRVDDKIDERMNIIVSSRGASRYLKRNNLTFNNWIYSLLSYNLGLTGAKSQVDPANYGATSMTIDENMHWYVLRFLAHKIMYQNAIENSAKMDWVLVEYIDGANKSIGDIASEHNLEKEKITPYNKWLKIELIPEDKIYPVVIVMPMAQAGTFTKINKQPKKETRPKKEKFSSVAEISIENISTASYTIIVNGTQGIISRAGDNIVKLSARGNISKEDFLKYNEIQSFDEIIPNKIYYLERKRNKAMVVFHTVQSGESLWSIAQNYGIDIQTIRSKNRMEENEALDLGRVLWLRIKRPKNRPVEYKAVEKKEIVTVKIIPSGIVYFTDTSRFVYSYHKALAGETLFGISKKYQTPTDSVMRWNNMQDYSIQLGQIIIVGVKEKQAEILFYSVATGDTFYKIAKQYNVTVEELQLWNNKTDLSLKLGEKLVIKKR